MRGAATGPIQTWQKSDGTNVVIIDSSGNVGIGITVPGAKLEVVGDIKFGTVSGPNAYPVGIRYGNNYRIELKSGSCSVAIGDGGWGNCTISVSWSNSFISTPFVSFSFGMSPLEIGGCLQLREVVFPKSSTGASLTIVGQAYCGGKTMTVNADFIAIGPDDAN